MSGKNTSLQMTISLNVLEHLGINLYSNVPSVLSEIIANAWDADASEVFINWYREEGKIVIQDDGSGMTPKEINDRFLNVGYRRRDEQPGKTPKGRRPMGRKGIGKLSSFSIANTVEIETSKDGIRTAFRMNLDDIRATAQQPDGNGTYEPEILLTDNMDFSRGTKITLSDLRRRQTVATTRALKKRIARRFSIIGPKLGFKLFVDNEEIQPSDRDYYDKVQYIWTYGNQNDVLALCNKQSQHETRMLSGGHEISISGWLATVREVKFLHDDEEGGNLNRIAVFVRGKLAQEDLLGAFSERGVYANYLIGELRVDGMDEYDGPGTTKDIDAATSSRQQFVEDDERYVQLRELVAGELKHIQNKWTEWRLEEGSEQALEIPEVRDWMENLDSPVKSKAKKWLGKLNRIRIDDVDEQKQLIKHAVLAFEFYRVNRNLDRLENIEEGNIQATLEIFEDVDIVERNLYGQIVQQRIAVIRTLEEKVDANALEKAIQEFIFDRLWLLDPAWDRVEGTEYMERQVNKLFQNVDAELTNEEKKGRLDIGYRKAGGQHVIVELKRPNRVVSLPELIGQISKYRSGMLKLLEMQNLNESIEIVIVLGRSPSDWSQQDGKENVTSTLKIYQARIVFYNELLENAYKSYQDYLKHKGDLDHLDKVMQAIDDYAPQDDET